MNTIGLGNALVDVLLKLENDDVLAEVGIQKGAMDMINQEQMIKIRKSQEGLERDVYKRQGLDAGAIES